MLPLSRFMYNRKESFTTSQRRDQRKQIWWWPIQFRPRIRWPPDLFKIYPSLSQDQTYYAMNTCHTLIHSQPTKIHELSVLLTSPWVQDQRQRRGDWWRGTPAAKQNITQNAVILLEIYFVCRDGTMKSLEPLPFSLYFARNIRNRCNNLFKNVQTYMGVQYESVPLWVFLSTYPLLHWHKPVAN